MARWQVELEFGEGIVSSRKRAPRKLYHFVEADDLGGAERAASEILKLPYVVDAPKSGGSSRVIYPMSALTQIHITPAIAPEEPEPPKRGFKLR